MPTFNSTKIPPSAYDTEFELPQLFEAAPPHCQSTGFCGEGVGPHRAPDALTGSKPAYLAQKASDPICSSSDFCGDYKEGGIIRYPEPVI